MQDSQTKIDSNTVDWYLQHAVNVLATVFLIWLDVQHERYTTEAHGEMNVWLSLKHPQVTEAISELILLHKSLLETFVRADCLHIAALGKMKLVPQDTMYEIRKWIKRKSEF